MKRFVILAALVVAPLVAVGCSCQKYNANDNCITYVRYNPNAPAVPMQVPCPPVAAPAPQPIRYLPAPMPMPAPSCPLPGSACTPVSPLAPLPPANTQVVSQGIGFPGRISYMEPIQVSGANQVQFYNPYAVRTY